MSDSEKLTNAEKLARIDSLHGTIPSFKCKPGCCDCCGPIKASRLEFYRCVKTAGRSVEDVRQQIEKNLQRKSYGCPFVDQKTKQCSVYQVRPTICRIFGTTGDLRCPHGYGAEPEQMLSEERSRELLALVEKLGA